ncbi:AAA family ATPase [Demequina globuliformis]|uniref:AAA family ATPase n=1 Tax=Demequina globuliformis TaxID=676202 RepID=UPI0007846657|nr:MoxR family ATPase [Demequina globuliformis]
MTVTPPTAAELEQVQRFTSAIEESMSAVVAGQGDAIRAIITTVLARGHLLMEDVPGVGKTTLARAFAASIDASVGRIQFTPDLLPADVTGVSIYRSDEHAFEFRPGPVFAHVVIADEINRASPKTQSALLESMQERAVTVDGTTRALPNPFTVVATQNPIEMEGTYPLPEAQRDRFMAQISVGYPSREAEMDMLMGRDGGVDPLAAIVPVAHTQDVTLAIGTANKVHASPAAKQYILDLVGATREHAALRLGASPRASLQLLAASRATAALHGRGHIIPEDVQERAVAVLSHRLLPSHEARVAGLSTRDIVEEIVRATRVPGTPRMNTREAVAARP